MSGGLSGNRKWPRIFLIAEISIMAEMALSSPPQSGQCFMSMENIRAKSSAHPNRCIFLDLFSDGLGVFSGVVVPVCSGSASDFFSGTIWERNLA